MTSSKFRDVPSRHLGSDFSRIRPPASSLKVWGELPDPEKPRVTIVGTRKASHHGLQVARKLGRGLGRRGCVVVSGLARGIDTAAHEGALEGGGVTVAFVGSGFNQITPRGNVRLAQRIVRQGAVVSEYEPEAAAQRFTFVARNRLMAAYGMGVVVVEAGERSGALITAGFALDLGKPVWAVPGDVLRVTTAGSNRLLRDGALVANDLEDILVGMGVRDVDSDEFEEPVPPVAPAQGLILKALNREGALPLDRLGEATGLRGGVLLAQVSELEILGLVVRTREGIAPNPFGRGKEF